MLCDEPVVERRERREPRQGERNGDRCDPGRCDLRERLCPVRRRRAVLEVVRRRLSLWVDRARERRGVRPEAYDPTGRRLRRGMTGGRERVIRA